MTAPLRRVLQAFLEDPAAPRYGYDLMKAADLKSGTLYPLQPAGTREAGHLRVGDSRRPGERPRKYYQLTGEGIRVARLELARVSPGRRRAAVVPVRLAPGSLG